MSKRVAVFIDYQNAYRSARAAFHDHPFDPHWYGQIHPLAFGALIVRLSADSDRHLAQVLVYRGLPSSSKDPKGYGAARRQISAWKALPRTHVTQRPLRYPRDYPASKPEEKGIDVQIAIDFVMMAVRAEYDVGILMSGDTDLLPALEAVGQLPHVNAEVAAWWTPWGDARRLRVSGMDLPCHWIPEAAYRSVLDDTDYNIPKLPGTRR